MFAILSSLEYQRERTYYIKKKHLTKIEKQLASSKRLLIYLDIDNTILQAIAI